MIKPLESSAKEVPSVIQEIMSDIFVVNASSLDDKTKTVLAKKLFNQYKRGYVEDEKLFTIVTTRSDRYVNVQPVTGVTEKMKTNDFETMLSEPGTLLLMSKQGDFVVVRFLDKDKDIDTALQDEFGSLEMIKSRKEGLDTQMQEAHQQGKVCSIVELSSASSLRTTALLLKLEEHLPHDAWMVAKVLDNVRVGSEQMGKIHTTFGGNVRGKQISERLGMSTIFAMSEAERTLSVPREQAKKSFPKLSPGAKNVSVPAKLAFCACAGPFTSIREQILHKPDAVNVHNFPQEHPWISRRTAVISGTGIGLAASFLTYLVLSNRSDNNPERNAIEIDNGEIQRLVALGEEYARDDTALPIEQGKLVRVSRFYHERADPDNANFWVDMYAFSTGGREMSYAYCSGKRCIAYVNRITSHEQQARSGLLLFEGDTAQSRFNPIKDTIGYLKDNECILKDHSTEALLDLKAKDNGTAATTWHLLDAERRHDITLLRRPNQLSQQNGPPFDPDIVLGHGQSALAALVQMMRLYSSTTETINSVSHLNRLLATNFENHAGQLIFIDEQARQVVRNGLSQVQRLKHNVLLGNISGFVIPDTSNVTLPRPR